MGEIGPVVTEVNHFLLYLRSSFIGGSLIWNAFIVYFGHRSLSIKFRNIGPVVAAIFHFWYLRSSFIICIIWGHRSLSLNFGENWTSGCWDIPFLIFEVFFHYFIGGRLHLKYFHSLFWILIEYSTSAFCDFPFLIFEVFFHHIIGGRLYPWHFSFVWSQKLMFEFWGRLNQWLLRYYIFNIWGLLPLFH